MQSFPASWNKTNAKLIVEFEASPLSAVAAKRGHWNNWAWKSPSRKFHAYFCFSFPCLLSFHTFSHAVCFNWVLHRLSFSLFPPTEILETWTPDHQVDSTHHAFGQRYEHRLCRLDSGWHSIKLVSLLFLSFEMSVCHYSKIKCRGVVVVVPWSPKLTRGNFD